MSRRMFGIVSALTDLVLINGSIILAFLIRFGGELPAYNFRAYLVMVPAIAVAYLFSGWIYGLYEPERVDTPWGVARSTFAAVTLSTVLIAAIAFFGGTQTMSFARWTIVLTWAIGILTFSGWRIGFLRWGTVRWPEQRTIIVGVGRTAASLGKALAEREKWGWQLVGFVVVDPNYPPSQPDMPLLGEVADLPSIIVRERINRVIVATKFDLRELVESLVLNQSLDVAVDVVPELYEIFFGSIDSIVGDVPLMRVVAQTEPRYGRVLKRAIDLVGATLLLVLLSPVFALAALAILLDDGAPTIFHQTRVGRGQRNFEVFKFRTMVVDAEAETGPVLATTEDPRITRVGRLLRNYRIDELPQLINVLRGEMSFIGPRPERPEFVAEHLKSIQGYGERFQSKPGITGLAQVNGGYATTPDLKLKYDLVYIYNQSLAMDFQVAVETLRVVLTGRGAR